MYKRQIEPGVAESWDVSDDGLTYTFHLRKSNWSDGTPLTANDFEYTWKRLCDPSVASPSAAGVTAVSYTHLFSTILSTITESINPLSAISFRIEHVFSLGKESL